MVAEQICIFYDGEYLIWSLVCKSWYEYLKKYKKHQTKLTHVLCSPKMMLWSQIDLSSKELLHIVVKNKFIDTYQYLEKNNLISYDAVLEAAAIHDQKYFIEQIFDIMPLCRSSSSKISRIAAIHDSIGVMMFLKSLNLPFHRDFMFLAIVNGSINVVSILQNFGHLNMRAAAVSKQYGIIEWALHERKPLYGVLDALIEYGSCEYFKSLSTRMEAANLLDDDLHELLMKTIMYDEILMTQHLVSLGAEFYGCCCEQAVECDSFRSLKWLLRHGCPAGDAYKIAVELNDSKMINWMRTNGFSS
jgi:hypothetical protein